MMNFALLAAAITSLPFTYSGRLVDWNHQAYSLNSGVEVRVRNAAGDLLCKTTTFAGGSDCAVNYRAAIPIASTRTAGYALVGERVTFEVTIDGEDYSGLIPSSALVIGPSGGSARLDLMLAKDTNNNGVADDYEALYAYRMGVDIYDPNGDFDGDGQSNFAEYIAGTSPVNPSDNLRINHFEVEADGEGDYFSFDLIAAPGRSYSVAESPVCRRDAAWTLLAFRTERDGVDRLSFTSGDAAERKTFFVPVDRTKKADFFTLKVE